MKRLRITDAVDHITEAAIANSATQLVPVGSVLIVTRSGILQHSLPVALNTVPVAINQDLKSVTPFDGIEAEFLLLQLQARATEILKDCAKSGTTVDSLDFERLKRVVFLLPPQLMQHRIVQKLNQLTERVARATIELNRIPALIGHYKNAVLRTAMRGDWSSEVSPKVRRFGDIVQSIRTGPFGSAVHRHDYVQGGVPLINPMHINDGKITPSADVSVSPEKAKELAAFVMVRDDVVIARRGVMGRCAVVGPKEEGWLIGTGSIGIRLKAGINPHFVQRWLSSPSVVEALEENSVGSTMTNLNQSVLLNLKIALPTEDEQNNVVTRIERAFAWLDQVVADHRAASNLLPRLETALLAKGTRGELTPHDPTDESATALLDRIRLSADKARRSRSIRKSAAPKGISMAEELARPLQQLSRDAESWPDGGLTFEEIAKRNPMPHDEIRDALFELLSGPKPRLRQRFDSNARIMLIQRNAA
jgi:type I restriction enzyme S subunit